MAQASNPVPVQARQVLAFEVAVPLSPEVVDAHHLRRQGRGQELRLQLEQQGGPGRLPHGLQIEQAIDVRIDVLQIEPGHRPFRHGSGPLPDPLLQFAGRQAGREDRLEGHQWS